MPRNLFAEAGIDPYSEQKRAPRDLFKEAGINPIEEKKRSSAEMVSQIISDQAKQALLGATDSIANLYPQLFNLALPEKHQLPLSKLGEGSAYNAGKFAGDVGGFLAGGEVLDSARAASEAVPYIGKLAKALGGDGLSGVSRRALGSGLYGATQNPDDKLAGAAEMGATSAALDAIFGGAAKLLPSNMLRGNISTEELLKNLEAARGTNTPLGDVVGSPNAKQYYENLTAKIPFSGSGQVSENISNQVKSAGKDIYDSLAGGVDKDDLKESIRNALSKASDEADKLASQHYSYESKLADSYGVKIDKKNFRDTAKSILEDINDNPDLRDEIADETPGLIRNLNRYSNTGDGTARQANFYKKYINAKTRKAYSTGDDFLSKIYGSLARALEKDKKEAFEATGNPELYKKYRKAQDFYRENVVPFEDPDVMKYIINTSGKEAKRSGDTDMILSTFIKPGKNDRANLLSKLMEKLPEEDKGLVPAAYFSSAFKDGELNPLMMKTLYKNLGDKQKEVLLSPEMKQKMDMFSRLTGMNERSLSRMANPMTGQQAIPAIVSKGLAGTGGSIGAVMGGLPGAIMGAMAAPVAVGAASKGFNKYMTSPNVRESMVKSIMQGSPRDKILKEIVKYLRPTLMAGMAQE